MTGIFSAIAAFPGIGAAATEAEFPRLEKPRVFELNHLGATAPLANDTKSRSSGRPAGHDPPATN